MIQSIIINNSTLCSTSYNTLLYNWKCTGNTQTAINHKIIMHFIYLKCILNRVSCYVMYLINFNSQKICFLC